MGRESIPSESLELRNQLEFYAPRCLMPVADASAPPVPADSAAVPPATPLPAATPAASTSFYSVQIAAYNSREPAVSLANTLVERGLEARVDGTAAPFRVRIGKFPTRAEAAKAASSLKAQGHNGFITLVK